MLEPDVTVGMTLTGALTPAGLGMAALIPLIEGGFVDWIISTGANLYHDTHFGLGLAMHRGNPQESDVVLREEGVVRIYDIFFDYDVLLSTDAFFRKIIQGPEFQRADVERRVPLRSAASTCASARRRSASDRSRCSSAAYDARRADLHVVAGRLVDRHERRRARARGEQVHDRSEPRRQRDGVDRARRRSAAAGSRGVLICGGGSPKNFMLQTEPQIQEVLGIDEKGHDYFLQITDARPDTGGLSGATPAEAVSWGKIDPDRLPDAVVCYLDSTVALPLLTAYAHARHAPRPLKRLYDRREAMMEHLRAEFARSSDASFASGAHAG